MTNIYAGIKGKVIDSSGGNKLIDLDGAKFTWLLDKWCNKSDDNIIVISLPRDKTLMFDFYHLVKTVMIAKEIKIIEVANDAVINCILNVASQLTYFNQDANKVLADFDFLTETALKVSGALKIDIQDLSASVSNVSKYLKNPEKNVPLAIMKMDLDGNNLEIYQKE